MECILCQATSAGIDMFQTNADNEVIIGFESSMLKLPCCKYPRIWWQACFAYYVDALVNICLLCDAVIIRTIAVKSDFYEGCCTCCVQTEIARLDSHVCVGRRRVNTGQTFSVGLDMLFS